MWIPKYTERSYKGDDMEVTADKLKYESHQRNHGYNEVKSATHKESMHHHWPNSESND